jgi:hypothetical protein
MQQDAQIQYSRHLLPSVHYYMNYLKHCNVKASYLHEQREFQIDTRRGVLGISHKHSLQI